MKSGFVKREKPVDSYLQSYWSSSNDLSHPNYLFVQMVQRRLLPEEYTVGWISALLIELAAAEVLLDEEYDSIP
jgi:hypothetical protein